MIWIKIDQIATTDQIFFASMIFTNSNMDLVQIATTDQIKIWPSDQFIDDSGTVFATQFVPAKQC